MKKKEGLTVELSCLSCLLGLLATGDALSQAPPIGQGGAAPAPPLVNRGSHVYTGGPTPRLTAACGTDASITGGDVAGVVRLGTDYAGTTCGVIFVQPWLADATNEPYVSCVGNLSHVTLMLMPWHVNVLPTGVVLNGGNASPGGGQPAVLFAYQCIGTSLPP